MMIELLNEVRYRTSRSSGAGGQNVNKVSTKVELLFDVAASQILSEDQKNLVFKKLKNRISNDGLLMLQCDETRSQFKNKEIVNERFLGLIEKALRPVKKRRPSRPTRASVEKRIKGKKMISEKKENRKKPD